MSTKTSEPLLSIIVPVYNVEKYVGATIESLLSQDYQNIEVILVNDGSTDKSLEICRDYSLQDSRVQVYTQENQGQSVARNLGLEHARGELITFMDSDDTLLPCTYSVAIETLMSYPNCDHVQFPLHKRVGTPNPQIIPNNFSPISNKREMIHNWVIERDISWIVCNKIFKRNAIQGLAFKVGFVYEDNLFALQQLKQSTGICFSQEGAYLYHYRPGSTTNTHSLKNNLDMIKVHIEIAEELKGLDGLEEARAYMSYMIACDVYAYDNKRVSWYSKNNEVSQEGMSFLRRSSLWEIITSKALPLKRKLKTVGIKVASHIL